MKTNRLNPAGTIIYCLLPSSSSSQFLQSLWDLVFLSSPHGKASINMPDWSGGFRMRVWPAWHSVHTFIPSLLLLSRLNMSPRKTQNDRKRLWRVGMLLWKLAVEWGGSTHRSRPCGSHRSCCCVRGEESSHESDGSSECAHFKASSLVCGIDNALYGRPLRL